MRRRWLPRLCFLALAFAAPASAAGREFTLPNGLRVMLAPDTQAVAVDVAVWYAAGPEWEPAGRSGLTHLMERLMFRGSPHFASGEYAKQLTPAGVSFNTLLAPDFSCLYSTGPSESLELVLRHEADRMSGPLVTAANVATEKRAIAEERRRLESVPFTRAMQQLYAAAFGGHPYARPLQGSRADDERLTALTCAEYAKARYGPGDAVLTVVGRFDEAPTEELVRRTFGALARRDPPVLKNPPLPGAGERRALVRIPSPLPMLLVGWRAPADSVAGAECALLAQILGSGPSSRLTADFVGKQKLALSAQATYDGRRQASLFTVSATLAPAADTGAVLHALVDQVERLAKEPVGDAELTRARKALLLGARLDRASVRGRAAALGAAMMTDGGFAADARRLEAIASIQPGDLQKVAARVLTERERTIVWALPEPAAPPARAAAARPPVHRALRKGGAR